MITAGQLAVFLGWDDLDEDEPDERLTQAEAVISAVASLARSYTRGAGWAGDTPASDINTVILTASARLISHPRQVGVEEVKGPESARWMSAPFTWSLGELMTLNRYRSRAM